MSLFLRSRRAAAKPVSVLSPENYGFLEQYIQREAGLALGRDNLCHIESRLLPVVATEGAGSLDGLCDLLRAAPSTELRALVVEAVISHETYFFRDAAVFGDLRARVVPEITERHRATRTLRVWSAACSSGQEPYSLAMLLLEEGYGNWNIQILGTDISSRILERARQGRYVQLEISNGLPPALLSRHFDRTGATWTVKDQVRHMVHFLPFDLRRNMRSMGPFDLVLCRNVLIYFDVETRRRILSAIHGTIAPSGYLLLGTGETAFDLDAGLVRKTLGNTVMYQVPENGKA